MARHKDRLKKDILKLLILTTVVVIIWVGFEVYFKLTNPIPSEVSEKVLRPLNPEFEEAFLEEEIKDRRFITDEELKDVSRKQVVLEKESEEATGSAEEATESGKPEGE